MSDGAEQCKLYRDASPGLVENKLSFSIGLGMYGRKKEEKKKTTMR